MREVSIFNYSPPHSNPRYPVKNLYIILIFVIAFLLYFFPVGDPDTGWHIKTGEYIATTHSLPEKDPFSYTAENDERTLFILKQYWLSQLFYYFVYRVGGWWGIIILRLTIYLSIILLFLRVSKNLNIYLRTGLAGFLVFALANYIIDRPAALTLLFFAITVFLIEKGKYYPIPFIMLIWANSHGGFITGDLLLLFYGLDFLREKKYRNALIIISGIAASLLNPNFIGAFTEFLYGNLEYYSRIAEYQSPVTIFMKTGTRKIAYYGLALGGIFLLLIPQIRRFRLPEVVAIAFFIIFAVKHMRVAPFLSILLSFVSVKYLMAYNAKIPKRLPRVDLLALVVMIFISGILIWDRRHPMNFSDLYFPRPIIKFFKEAKPRPNVYNSYNTGGFLIFALYPDYRVFLDPRGISFKAFKESAEIENASKNMDALLSKHNVNVIVASILDPYVRRMSPLLVSLLSKDDWKLVFINGTISVFIKDIPEHSEIIKKYEMKKDNIYRAMVVLCGIFLAGDQENASLYFLLAGTYEQLKMYDKAIEAVKVGLEIKKDPAAEGMLKRIEQKMKSKKSSDSVVPGFK